MITTKKIKISCLLFIFSVFHSACQEKATRLLAENGVLDLRGIDFEKSGPVHLNGEWEFYWSELYSPEDFASNLNKQPEFIRVPGNWSRVLDYPALGYATYRLKVLLDEGQDLALIHGRAFSSSQSYLNGQLISQVGKTHSSDDPEYYQAMAREKLIPLGRQGQSLELIIQVANFEIFVAGVIEELSLGYPQQVMAYLNYRRGIALLFSGIFLTIGLYHLILYSFRVKEPSPLYFALLCFSVLGHHLASPNGLIAYYPAELNFNTSTRLFNAWIPGVVFFTYFTAALYPKQFSPKIAHLIAAITLPGILFILFADARHFVPITSIYQGLALIMSLYWGKAIVQAIRAKEDGARIFATGGICMVAASLNDIGAQLGLFESKQLGSFGMTTVILFQSIILAQRFSYAFRRIAHLSKNLQKEVKSQTQKLEVQRDKLIEQKKDLVQAHEQLQKHDEQKTRFFQNISHELRTPLTLILGSLTQAFRELGQSKSLQVADRNAKRLLRLVNQLLDFQKMSSGNQDLILKKIDLACFLSSLSRYFQPSCEEHSIQFELSMMLDENEERLLVEANLDALEKIVFNYLSNALKFTPAGGSIRLSLKSINQRARIEVSDSGPGIEPEQIHRLFRVFSQLDDSSKREFEGTGLGLALVKELAQRMNGEVGVYSQPGKGSRFWLELPICIDESRTIDLLVVDDDPLIRQHFEDELQQHQICESFRVVASPQEARRILDYYRVHCILSDAVMPDEDGPSLLSHAAELQPQSKRILMTGRNKSHNIVQKAINTTRIDRIFYKPIDSSTFAILKTMIDEAKVHQSHQVLDLLVIDDEQAVLMSIRSMMIDSEQVESMEFVEDLSAARQLMRSHRIRCVLVDANLSAADGTDFLVEISQLQPDCYRIMITGENSPEVLEKAINQAHIDQVIYKPLHKADVIRLVEQAIQNSSIQAVASLDTALLSDYQPKDWHLADLQQAPGHEIINHYDEKIEASRDECILIADDVDDMRDLIQSVLQADGYHLLGARNGEEALDIARNHSIDLIITDWMMPKKSGPELIADLQEDSSLAGIPTILLTAKGDDVSKMMATRDGASAYLAKPFDEMELRSTVKNLLKLKEGERQIAQLHQDMTENVLKRFLPPHLVNEFSQGHKSLLNEASVMPVTIVFADLCRFTQTSEDLGPRRISKVLNEYLETMTAVIFEHGGTIDKFIGDAVMVIFGAPEKLDVNLQASKACNCGLAMQDALANLSVSWQREGLPAFEMRIGIHHGAATVGMFGGQKRADYTAIGPAVNLAARVESVAKPGEVLITSSVRDLLAEDNWEKAGNFDLKGVGEQIPLYRILTVKRQVA